ncbi:hypothetical protein EST38_g7422 [Candolleomyces aberdarensis]|uniref:HAMP domain-containing protein n=1 Tax=Candolleomyces aberdarensis TaxID=2316362 RepID=A0A4Q2DF65_9AGAR|nr:hypothetical protein EST38_g7422 [Candolleomyces aberdarensis]
MAGNLTTQVRGFAQISAAAMDGDFTRFITVEASGEMDSLRTQIKQMMFSLSDSIQKNTAAREAAELANRSKRKFLANMSLGINHPPIYLDSIGIVCHYGRVLNSPSTDHGGPAPSSSATAAAQSDPMIYAPQSTPQSLPDPLTQHRRVKRTEEERIANLRADPHVAEFEAYRARKTCLAKSTHKKNANSSPQCSVPFGRNALFSTDRDIRAFDAQKSFYNKNANFIRKRSTLFERNSLFSTDSGIREFDAGRVLCNWCAQWLPVPPEDHADAVQQWYRHKEECRNNLGSAFTSGYVLFAFTHVPA